jgi:endonuclease/exonuclease/phosphatase family metal-dependent hydrolase
VAWSLQPVSAVSGNARDPCLHVASYNVHSWVGRDGRRDAQRAADVIRELGAHVVALQEVHLLEARRAWPLLELCEEQRYELVEGITLHYRDAPYGNALLTRLPVRSTSQIDLSVRRLEPRGALAVDVAHAGRIARIVATHLGLWGWERRRQVRRLLHWIESIGGERPAVTALMGDFNEWLPRAASLRFLAARFGAVPAPRTFPAFLPLVRLDRIWATPRSVVRRVTAHDSRGSRTASDHLPVTAVLDLSAADAVSSGDPVATRPRCSAHA